MCAGYMEQGELLQPGLFDLYRAVPQFLPLELNVKYHEALQEAHGLNRLRELSTTALHRARLLAHQQQYGPLQRISVPDDMWDKWKLVLESIGSWVTTAGAHKIAEQFAEEAQRGAANGAAGTSAFASVLGVISQATS